MYLRYGIPRAIRGLRSNWRAHINNILILAASMATLGMIVLLYLNVLHFSRVWLSNTNVSIFLLKDIPANDQTALLNRVRNHPLVKSAELVSPAEGLRRLAEQLGADQEMLTGAGVEDIPPTIDFRLLSDHREQVAAVAEQFRPLPGVEEVVYTERMLEQVALFFLVVEGIGWFFIVLLLISVYLVIAHATRLSLYARRDEIEILSLVGATRRFIRSSFVVEGLLLGLLGSMLSLGLVWLAHQLLLAGLSWNEATIAIQEDAVFFPWSNMGAALVIAALVGAASSRMAVHRLLRDFEP